MPSEFFNTHEATLQRALKAIAERSYWSAYPEIPSGKVYGESAKDEGLAAFKAQLNKPFELEQPGSNGTVGSEKSPYGIALDVQYPKADIDGLISAATKAQDGWKRADVETRVGVCLEILHRLNKASFEMSFAVMHTTGQGWMMAFQAGGPHAQDRGLEAVAYAWLAMKEVPANARWTKRVGRDETVTLDKRFRIVPRGLSLNIACSTFPTWNSYPGLFASLATGNAVILKPHPGAILPLAITTRIAREVLSEAGFDPNVITLAADSAEDPITKDLATRPEIKLIDYTGSSAFGDWLENNARQALVFTEKAGVNSLVIDSVDDLRAVTGNIAFSLSLYSGQMCTATQNIFIPKDGIKTSKGDISFDETAQAIVKALDWLLGDPKRGAEILGAIHNENTLNRVDEAGRNGADVLRAATPVANETFPDARVRSPLVIKTTSDNRQAIEHEMFGPIVYIVQTQDTDESLAIASDIAAKQGAITMGVYSTDPDTIAKAEDLAAQSGVALSCNLTGSIWLNQSAAFSDFHVSGANPAGNATLCDTAFVAPRFRVVQCRTLVPTPAPAAANG